MASIIVRHKVSDYTKWKKVYDQYKPTVKSMGGKSQSLMRSAVDPHELVILTKFDNVDLGRKWAESEDLKKAMKEAGVSDQPTVYFLDELEDVVL